MSDETSFAVVLSVAVSGFVALLASTSVCSAQHLCLEDGGCDDLGDSFCSFSNRVSPSGYRLFNLSLTSGTLASLERGVCPPGERQSLIDNTLTCLRARSYPVALQEEIYDTSSSSWHRRYCGRWIDSQSAAVTGKYWSFFDAEAVAADVTEAVTTKTKIRGSTGAMGRFRAACVKATVSNAQGAAVELGYNHLRLQFAAATDQAALLRMVGVLAGHFCDAPAMVGITFRHETRLDINVTSGVDFDGEALADALYAVGATRSERLGAARFANLLKRVTLTTVTLADAEQVAKGSVEGTALENQLSTSVLHAGPNLQPLARFIGAFQTLGAADAVHYLHGAAARCALAARSIVTGELTGIAMSHRAALGRVSPVGTVEIIKPSRVLEATTTTLSQLSATSSLVAASRRTAHARCADATAKLFPDEMDKAVFDAVVSPALYSRLENVVAVMKNAVSVTIRGPIVAPTLYFPLAVSAEVDASVTRVAGAPRGTWGGREGAILSPGFDARDGYLTMALKQARAVYIDRIRLAVSGTSPCNMPALFTATSRNAYYIPGQRCSMLLPGILVPPFADPLYDDASIYARIGYIIGHELAHSTYGQSWRTDVMNALLTGYAASTQSEAIADIVGVAAVMATGKVDNASLCAHVSQVWCGASLASKFPLFYPLYETSHPAMNKRGDLACDFIQKYYS